MIGVDVHLPVPEHDNLFALLTLLGSRAAVIHVRLHLGDLLVERAEGTDLHPSLTERSLVLLHLAGLHHLAAVWALLAGVELLLVLLQLGARHGLVAHRAQGDVARAVQRVHHVAGGRDVPPAGEERTSYERAFCQETRILTSSTRRRTLSHGWPRCGRRSMMRASGP